MKNLILVLVLCSNFCIGQIFEINSFQIQKDSTLITSVDTVYYSNLNPKFITYNYRDSTKRVISFFTNGGTKSLIDYKLGNYNGLLLVWNENGTRMSEEHWLNGSKHGDFFYWYENGKIKERQSYINSTTWNKVSYYENGKVQMEETTEEKKSTIIHYCENGVVKSKYILKSGEQKIIIYDCERNILIKGNYLDIPTARVGKWIEYYPNGKTKQISFYKKTKNIDETSIPTGKWKYYSEKGELEIEKVYNDGKLIETKEYNKKGIAAPK